MKQNIEFYPHYATSDQHAKFKMLRVQFGWEGEGKFWALNNRIALSERCCLDITKKYNKAALASDLDFTSAKFDEFITFLECDCELIKKCENGAITTDIIQEVFAKVMQERGKARERHRRTSGEKVKTSGEKIDRVKESKGKENKEEENKDIYTPIFNFWNSQKIIHHRKLDDKTKTAIRSVLKTYEEAEILQAIENYSLVLKSDKYYWTHKWPLVDFINRGIKNFIPEADPTHNYLEKQEQAANGTKLPKVDYSNIRGRDD